MSDGQPKRDGAKSNGGSLALKTPSKGVVSKPKARSFGGDSPRLLSAKRWLWGLCGGLVVAVALLFCASGWGVAITAQGGGPGGWVFYGGWLLSLVACLVLSLQQARLGMGLVAALGWIGAGLGSVIRASDAMRWHPVVLGMNLGLLLLGLLSLFVVLGYARSVQRRAQG